MRTWQVGMAVLAVTLSACEMRNANTITRGEIGEIISSQVSGFAGYNPGSADSRAEFEAARVERRRGLINARSAMRDGVDRAFAVNGLASGLVEITGTEDSPYFSIDLTDSGWQLLQRAFDQEVGPLEVQITNMSNRECRDAEEGARECAADVRFRVRATALWRGMLGDFRSEEYEGRPVFERTLDSGEWEIKRWGREPEPVDDRHKADNLNVGEELERFVEALPAARVTAFDTRVNAVLQPRFEAAQTEARSGETSDLQSRGYSVGASNASTMRVNWHGAEYTFALPARRASSLWGLLDSCWNLTHAGSSDWYLAGAELYGLLRRSTVFDRPDAATEWRRTVLNLARDDDEAAVPAEPAAFSFYTAIAAPLASSLEVSRTAEDNSFIFAAGTWREPFPPGQLSRLNYWEAQVREGGFGGRMYRSADVSALAQPLANGGRYRGVCARRDQSGNVVEAADPAAAPATTP